MKWMPPVLFWQGIYPPMWLQTVLSVSSIEADSSVREHSLGSCTLQQQIPHTWNKTKINPKTSSLTFIPATRWLGRRSSNLRASSLAWTAASCMDSCDPVSKPAKSVGDELLGSVPLKLQRDHYQLLYSLWVKRDQPTELGEHEVHALFSSFE